MPVIQEEILSAQLSQHAFDGEEAMVSGIANRAVDPNYGWESLSPAQKNILNPFLSHQCDGYKDPGGEHSCPTILTEERLLEAWENNPHYDALLCSSCRGQRDYFSYRRERIDRE